MNSATSPVTTAEKTGIPEVGQAHAPVQPPIQALPEAAQTSALMLRNQELEAMLARTLRQHEALSYGISHDLRAPLRAIDGFAVQLQRRLQAQAGDADAHDALEKIRAATARMGGLLDSLVEYSRIARCTPKSEPVDLSFVADWALMDLHDAHPQLPIEADVQPGLLAQGDERLLRSMFDKLFDNSRKFADPARGLQLSVRGEAGADGVHLEVADHGIGMALRDAAQPFEPFQRLHGSSQGGGDGLGLAIVQAIVQRLDGRIWLESGVGSGTRVHIVLPAAVQAAKA